jgi:hypothetical protein
VSAFFNSLSPATPAPNDGYAQYRDTGLLYGDSNPFAEQMAFNPTLNLNGENPSALAVNTAGETFTNSALKQAGGALGGGSVILGTAPAPAPIVGVPSRTADQTQTDPGLFESALNWLIPTANAAETPPTTTNASNSLRQQGYQVETYIDAEGRRNMRVIGGGVNLTGSPVAPALAETTVPPLLRAATDGFDPLAAYSSGGQQFNVVTGQMERLPTTTTADNAFAADMDRRLQTSVSAQAITPAPQGSTFFSGLGYVNLNGQGQPAQNSSKPENSSTPETADQLGRYLDTANTVLIGTGIAANITEMKFMDGTSWLANNGQRYSLTFRGNQYVGGWKTALEMSDAAHNLGTGVLIFGTLVSAAQGIDAYKQGDSFGVAKSTMDVGVGAAAWAIGGKIGNYVLGIPYATLSLLLHSDDLQ